jgi:hypothetical protein
MREAPPHGQRGRGRDRQVEVADDHHDRLRAAMIARIATW